MAIEIIRKGIVPNKKQYEGTCCYCRTKIKCLQEDGKIINPKDQRDDPYLDVACPLCENTINCYAAK